MNPAAAAWEAALCTAYEEEAGRYARALQLAEDLPAILHQGQGHEEKLLPILSLLDEVAATEARIAESKQQWQQHGQAPGPELQAVLTRVAGLIERLATRIREAEVEAVLQRNLLEPELDAAIRSQHMQRAYDEARTMLDRPSNP